MNRKLLLVLLVAAAAGCAKKDTKAVVIQTATVTRRNIEVDVTATGVIEPINVIEIKSKTASGQVTFMPVQIGSNVKPGDLIVQIDTTNLHTTWVQATADLGASQSNFDVAQSQLKRQTDLYDQHIITKTDLEAAQTQFSTARAQLTRNQASLDLSVQSKIDAKVVASIEGTLITAPVSLGQVVQAGATSVSGGTVIATMANLSKVRSRALVNETDIGSVAIGQQVTVTVDAFPNNPFTGIVEKIEPQAVVQQNVTMFPVLVNLKNPDGLLKPGMNGEVKISTDYRENVIAVPNDAIRSTKEAAQAAALLNLNPDSVRAALRGPGGGGVGGGRSQGGGAPGGQPVQVQVGRGLLDLPLQGGGQQGGMGRGQMPTVTDADCKKVDAAMKKNPAIVKQLDDLRAKMQADRSQFATIREQMTPLYAKLGVDMMVAGACRRRADGENGGGGANGSAAGNGARGGPQSGAAGRSGRAPAVISGAQALAQSGTGRSNHPRSGLVFVQSGATWIPKLIRIGVANYDYTEVLDGVQEGDKVAMLSAAALQAKRQEQNDKMKSATSPLGGSTPARGAGGGGRGPGG